MFATLVATAFHVGIRFISKVEIIGLANYTGSPSTLVISNSKRDPDMLVIGPALHFGDRFPRPLVRPYFVAREDEFAPSFLATYYNLPQWRMETGNSWFGQDYRDLQNNGSSQEGLKHLHFSPEEVALS